MSANITFALAHPVFDPHSEIVPGHFWLADKRITAGLTVNLGLE